MMRYSRTLPEDFVQLLLPGGPLRFIVDLVLRSGSCSTDKALDLQLREDGETRRMVTLYRGGTAILNMRYDSRAGELKLSAHKKHQDQFQRLRLSQSYAIKDSENLEAEITGYLENVSVGPHHLREGGCENWLSHRYGRLWQKDEWVAVDREVVIGYKDRTEKEAVWGPIKKQFEEFVAKPPAPMGSKKTVGNELDCLLWQPSTGEFLITEVKDGGDPAGVYRSPIQVAAYLAIWRQFVKDQPKDALDGVRGLLAQKQRLGLIPEGVPLPERINALRPAIIVQDPIRKNGCREKLDAVIKQLQKDMPRCLDGLRLWAVEENQLTKIKELREIKDTWRE